MRTTKAALLVATAILGASPAVAMDDNDIYWRVDAMAERRITSVAPAYEWKASAWVGGDNNKLRLQNSGVLMDDGRIDGEGGTKGIDTHIYYSRRISDFWDAKAGGQFTVFGPGLHRSGFVAGFEGLAPQGFYIDAVAGISETGVVSARLDARYDLLLSQRLIAQPFAEAMLASADDRAIRLGSGLSRLEVGLRLRYEIVKELAPFVGVSFEQFTGATAGFVTVDGEPTSNLRALAGLKLWF